MVTTEMRIKGRRPAGRPVRQTAGLKTRLYVYTAGLKTRLYVGCFAAWLLASPVFATVLVPVDFNEIVSGSQLIVYGRVVDVRAQMVGDRRTIESVVTVSVMQAIKGDPGITISMRVPGGEVGRYRRFMIGAPSFRSGEEVVLFLSGRPPSIRRPPSRRARSRARSPRRW